MLKLGDEVTGRTLHQDWSGTVVGMALERGTGQLKAKVVLSEPIKGPDGNGIPHLVVPRSYSDPRDRESVPLGNMMMHQYIVMWVDRRRQPTMVFANWAVKYPDKYEFFLWRQQEPLVTIDDPAEVATVIPEETRGQEAPIVHPVIDRDPTNTQPICPMCCTWVCHSCYEYRRPRANRNIRSLQRCARCGEDRGERIALRHRNPGLHLN